MRGVVGWWLTLPMLVYEWWLGALEWLFVFYIFAWLVWTGYKEFKQ